MSKKLLFRFLRITGTSALLVYVLHKAGLFSLQGWQEFLDTLIHVNVTLILLSLGLGFLMNLSSAIKWLTLTRALNLPVNLQRLLIYYIVGKFFNLVLPSSVGGDVIRMQQLGRYTGRFADASASVFVERFSGLAVLVGLALVSVVLNFHMFNMPWLTLPLGLGVLGIGAICWLIVDDRPYEWVRSRTGKTLPILQGLLTKIGKFRQAIVSYRQAPNALRWALFHSLVFYGLAIANVWITLLAVGSEISFWEVFVAVPIIMFIMNLPISVGGIGLMEFAYSFVLGLMGVAPALAISAALFVRLKSLVNAALGGVLYSLIDDQRLVDLNPSTQTKEAVLSPTKHPE